jgi:hypothetical protein
MAARYWSCGDNGAIWYFDGSTWATMSSGTSEHLKCICAVNRNDIWCGGRNAVLLHWNGISWSSIPHPWSAVGSTYFISSILAFATNDVYASIQWEGGSYGGVMRWDGATWTVQFNITANYPVSVLVGSSTNDVYAFTASRFFIRNNTGSWVTGSFDIVCGACVINASDMYYLGNFFSSSLAVYRGSASTFTLDLSLSGNQRTGGQGMGCSSDGSLIFACDNLGHIYKKQSSAWDAGSHPFAGGSGDRINAVFVVDSNDALCIGSDASGNNVSFWNGSTWTPDIVPGFTGLNALWGESMALQNLPLIGFGGVPLKNLTTDAVGASYSGIESRHANLSLALWSNRADGAGNKSILFVADNASASITATHKVASFVHRATVGGASSYANETELGYFTGDGSLISSPAGTERLAFGTLPAGVSADYGISSRTATDILGIWGIKSTAAGAVSVQVVADANAAALDAGHKVLSIGWNNNADSFVELDYFGADGTLYYTPAGTLQLQMGLVPAGISGDYGIATGATASTLSLWSIRANGAGNISAAIVADVNNATIDAAHQVLTIGWVNNADSYSALFTFTDSMLQISSTASAQILSTEADGGSAVAVTVGSDNSFVTAGAKLLSVLNGSSGGYERANIDYLGNLAINKINNGQVLEVKTLTELTTIDAAATTTTAIQIPAGAIVIAVSTRVTVVIPTAATYSIGVAAAATRYCTGISVAAGTTDPGTADALRYYSAATGILITPNASPAANTGRMRVTIHYILITPPTS